MAIPKSSFFHYLAVYGCISTGIIYLAVGVIAILSFLKIKQGGADESSLFVFLNDFILGKILVWAILFGTACYVLWRIIEAVKDPYENGSNPKGLALRTGIGLSSFADAFIAYSAVVVLLGTDRIREDGQPIELREQVSSLMTESYGVALIIAIGIVIGATGAIQAFYGFSKGYKERIDVEHLPSWKVGLIHLFAAYGYLARGIILGIIGFFFIKAGFSNDGNEVVNTDKAFDFIGDHVGHFYFIAVAIGTIFYGVFMFLKGSMYDSGEVDRGQ